MDCSLLRRGLALALCLFCLRAFSQPLLFIGKADAELSGAFSYDFLKSPLSRPFDAGRAQVSLNLPINASAQAEKLLGSVADSSVVIPDIFTRISQHLNAQVDVSSPVPGGIAFFAARENASLTVSGALGDARFDIDTTLKGGNSVLLKGSVHMPLVFDMSWRSLTFGYAFRPASWLTFAFQIHKHEFTAHTSGDLRPDISGRIAVGGDAGNTSFDVEYPDSKVYGSASGFYQGKTWSPEMGVGLGPLRLVSRMGAHMAATGHLDVTYSVPYFINPKTFEPRFTSPDSFLAAGNLSRLLNSETASRVFHIRDRLILNLPQSHTISLDIVPKHLTLSYTKVFGHVSIHGETPDAGAGGNGSGVNGGNASRGGGSGGDSSAVKDSTLLDTDGFVDLDLFPDQVICLSTELGWFHGDFGMHTLNMNYRHQYHLLSGISPFEWNGDPMVPILNLGITWGDPLKFTVDFYVSPLPAVRSNVTYGF